MRDDITGDAMVLLADVLELIRVESPHIPCLWLTLVNLIIVPPAATTLASPFSPGTKGGVPFSHSGLDRHIGLGSHVKREPAHVVEHVPATLGVQVNVVARHDLSHGAHALGLVGSGVAAAYRCPCAPCGPGSA
eukprot:929741-Pleurochrysis_carterae.AAC.1